MMMMMIPLGDNKDYLDLLFTLYWTILFLYASLNLINQVLSPIGLLQASVKKCALNKTHISKLLQWTHISDPKFANDLTKKVHNCKKKKNYYCICLMHTKS